MMRPEPARCPVSGCSADATSTLSTEDHQTLSRVGVEVYSTYCAEHADGMREAARSVRTPCDPYDLADWERRECPECRGTRCGCPDCEGHGYLPCGEVA